MRKRFGILILIVALGALLAPDLYSAADVTTSKFFTATGSSIPINILMKGIYYHQASWSGTGTRTSCAAAVESSDDNITWATLIDITDCSTNGVSSITTGTTGYIRITVSALTGAGNTVYISYGGYVATIGGGGHVTVDNLTTDPAHGAADTGNPVKIGGKAITAWTTVDANDRTNATFDILGRIVVVAIPLELQYHVVSTTTDTNENTTSLAADASNKWRIMRGVCYNTSATGTRLLFKNGSGGAVLGFLPCPPNYGGSNIQAGGLIPISSPTAVNTIMVIVAEDAATSIHYELTAIKTPN